MVLSIRPFHWNQDFKVVQQFLSDTFDEQNPFHNWFPSRFENIRFGPCGTEYLDEEEEYIKIWEDESNIVAITFVKPSGESWIQSHPDFRMHEIKIIKWIEQRIHENNENQTEEKGSFFIVPESDRYRGNLLSEMGYSNQGLYAHNRYRLAGLEIPICELPDGYKIRTVKMNDDFERYREVMGSVFPHCSKMTKALADTYTKAEFYHPELDFVVVAPDEAFAAFTTIRLDPVGLLAELEPVGVHP